MCLQHYVPSSRTQHYVPSTLCAFFKDTALCAFNTMCLPQGHSTVCLQHYVPSSRTQHYVPYSRTQHCVPSTLCAFFKDTALCAFLKDIALYAFLKDTALRAFNAVCLPQGHSTVCLQHYVPSSRTQHYMPSSRTQHYVPSSRIQHCVPSTLCAFLKDTALRAFLKDTALCAFLKDTTLSAQSCHVVSVPDLPAATELYNSNPCPLCGTEQGPVHNFDFSSVQTNVAGNMSASASFSSIYTGTRESNGVIRALLTDLYQITMAYAYWKSGKMNDKAVFDLCFRRNPFKGEFTLFAGLEECVKLLQNFHFSKSDIDYLMESVPCRLLVATNAMRFRIAAGPNKTLLEFGLRRAQGPDGGLSASRYCYLGGFDGTSNVLAGKMFGIPVRGTHAHAFVTSYRSLQEIRCPTLKHRDTGKEVDFVSLCLEWQAQLATMMPFLPDQVSKGELASFIAYAQAFPDCLLALIDTYDVLRSGLPNFCTVAMALNDLGYRAVGIRLDSGDLAYLSLVVRDIFRNVSTKFNLPWFENLTIVASNDINEDTIHSLNTQNHHIDSFGIGTHLVTCQKQPALGCVFKLVEVNNNATMKLSEDVEKVTLPGRKRAYRLYGADGTALVDLMIQIGEQEPTQGQRLLCRHPTQESKRAYVSPARIEMLHHEYWKEGKVVRDLPPLASLRTRAFKSLETVRQDHKRMLNPTPYKVSVTSNLYTFIHDLWLQSAPIGELA
ncbi:nicotinate phosphoribosyltransferase-like [Babylonia areolata]|uniref:nicotinate phosphoribosyltransferase-like n=1 Tax=Babylonia areolata TaxID=304850 RepID=UPI003FCF77F8